MFLGQFQVRRHLRPAYQRPGKILWSECVKLMKEGTFGGDASLHFSYGKKSEWGPGRFAPPPWWVNVSTYSHGRSISNRVKNLVWSWDYVSQNKNCVYRSPTCACSVFRETGAHGPTAPEPSSAVGTVLLQPVGFSAVDWASGYNEVPVDQYGLLFSSHRFALFARRTSFPVFNIRSIETLERISALNLTTAVSNAFQ